MKKFLLVSLTFMFVAFAANAQEKEITPAAKGVTYGLPVSSGGPEVDVNELKNKLVDDKYEGKVVGKVKEVCKAEGCWIRLERADGTTMMVRAKDHSFLMPVNMEGKTVVIEGTAVIKEISEELRKHYAEDAGKSKKEIAKIKGPEKDVQFSAKGVMVLD